MRYLSLVSLILFAFVAAAGEPEALAPEQKPIEWLTDMDAARQQAAKDGKDILLLFDVPDDERAVKMRKEIYESEHFRSLADKFVFVRLDFPQQTEVAPDVLQKNTDVGVYFDIDGYPTLIILDNQARAYGVVSGLIDSLDNFKKVMKLFEDNKIKRDALLQAAEAVPETERAPLLSAAFSFVAIHSGLRSWSLYGYEKVFADIIALDPKNEIRQKIIYEFRIMVITSKIMSVKGDLSGAEKAIDKFIKDYPENSQPVYAAIRAKVQCRAVAGDVESVKELLNRLVKADPEGKFGKEAAETLLAIGEIEKAEKEKQKGQ